MKEEEEYSYQNRCPNTGKVLSFEDLYDSSGVCSKCGHVETGSVTHHKKISGKWVYPSVWEWLKGKRPYFKDKPH